MSSNNNDPLFSARDDLEELLTIEGLILGPALPMDLNKRAT